MMGSSINWAAALAISHGGICLGMCIVVIYKYLRSRSRTPMLLVAISYMALTVINVRAIAVWGRPGSPWFWSSLVAWILGDAGLLLYLILGPPARGPDGRFG